MTERRKRPRDPAQLAKLIVDIATGEVKEYVSLRQRSAGKTLARQPWVARAARRGPPALHSRTASRNSQESCGEALGENITKNSLVITKFFVIVVFGTKRGSDDTRAEDYSEIRWPDRAR